MTLLDRYLIDRFLRFLGICVGAFTAIYLVIDFLEKLRRFSGKGAASGDVFLFFLYKLPEIIHQVLPLAVLMATLLTIGALSRTSEITAMRSAGLSVPRLGRPLLVLGLLTSLGCLLLNEFVEPRSYAAMKQVEDIRISRRNPNTFFRLDNIWYRDEQTILQARLFEPASQTLRGVTVWQLGTGLQPTQRLDAKTATFDGKGWTLHELQERDLLRGGAVTGRAATRPITLDLQQEDLKLADKYADNLGFLALWRYTSKLQEGGYDATRYRAQMHGELAYPFSCLVMAFLGIPFALRNPRSGGVALGVAASVGIGFAYFVVHAVLSSFGQSGALPPLVAAWAANAIFTLFGCWLSLTLHG